MRFSEVKLPSNKTFGLFFTTVFFILACYFWQTLGQTGSYIFISLTIITLLITLTNAELLLPFNKLWMKLGFLLGIIVSPFILGLIFFTLFTPVAISFRIIGRDELNLLFKQKKSYWIKRETEILSQTFKNQF